MCPGTVPATGRPAWEACLGGLVRPHALPTPTREARGSGNFLRWESVVGLKHLGVFRVNRQRRGSFLCWRWQGLSGCTWPVSRPLRSAGKMPTVFIFHLSLQEVGG